MSCAKVRADGAAGRVGLLLACLGLVALGYHRAGGAFWVADDYVLLFGQARADGLRSALGMGEGTTFLRPVLAVSYWIDRALTGVHAATFHWHGFVLHAVAAWLLGLLTQAWSGRALAGAVAALVFAAFPLHPEAVTWISARGYPLAACWTLLAVLLARSPTAAGIRRAALGCFAAGTLALFSVEPALPLAAYAPLLLWGERRRFGRREWAVVAALGLASAAYLAFRVSWLGGLGGYARGEASLHTTFDLGRTLRFVLQASAQLVQPGPSDDAGSADTLRTAWVWCLALLLASVRFTAAGIRAGLALGGCVLAALSVVAHWATLGDDLSGVRYLYFPSLWLALGVGVLAAHAWERGGPSRWVGAAAALVLLGVQVPLLRGVNERWREAGELAARVVDGLRERHAATGQRHFMLHGVPGAHRGAHVVPWGLEAAVELFVASGLRVEVVPDPTAWAIVVRTAEAAPAAQRTEVALGEWVGGETGWRWR